MATHKQRRQGYYTQGKSGAYTICTPGGSKFAHTARVGGAWPVYVVGTNVLAATFTTADQAISPLGHMAVSAVVGAAVGGLYGQQF